MKWQDYAPLHTTRRRENIEWSINYQYNALDTVHPRVLLIGDSICNGYHGAVRARLDGLVNVSFWASSQCVTDPDYFRDLDRVLRIMPCSMVCFNNGLHSLVSDREEWTQAHSAAVAFIADSLPESKLSLTLCTPLTDSDKTSISSELNDFARDVADDRELDVIDLFTPMDALERERYWRDVYHFTPEAISMQADIIAAHVLDALGLSDARPGFGRASTVTGPEGGIK